MTFKKYFIAIVIPEPFLSELEFIKQELFETHGLKGALRSPSHITLHRPFEWREEKENSLTEKLSAFKFDKPIRMVLKDFAFFEPRVIYANVLENELLVELHKNLTLFVKRELRLFNEAEDLRGFHPHVTVAFRDLKKPLFYELQKDFSTRKINGTFESPSFSLLKLEQRWEVLKDFSF